MNRYFNPVQTICGKNALSELPSLLSEIIPPDGRVLLITWNESTAQLETFVQIRDAFHVQCVCFNESNPTVEQLFELYRKTAEFSPEVVVAVGGGSVMDVGKSLCCFYGKSIASADEMRCMISEKSYGGPKAKWIGVPTTSGTGSEVTCWATIWDPTQNVKRSVESRENYAYAAVVDPNLTKSMPLSLAVSSALDAAAHAVEAYWANGSNAVSKALALGAVRTIMTHIDGLLEGDESAYESMAQGSMIAGMAFSNTKTTACHSISYPLTMHFHIPHGTAVSMLLAPVMKINAGKVQDMELLLEALGADSCEMLSVRIKDILKRAGIPCTLSEWNVEEESLPMLAAQGLTPGRADNNPVSITKEKIEEILRSIYR
ncbi:MAG: phosphonoacetaldehyde reductase [Ruminococcus sp.]|nr:phosphonoacetaldehyde reductase [Ruminococcus sp.]